VYYSPHSTVLSGSPGPKATEFRFGGISVWNKKDDPKPSSPVAPSAPVQRVEPVRSVAGLTAEVVQPSGGVITSTLVIKGEIRGAEDLYIDGEVHGVIQLSEGRVTVGPHGQITANIDAREIIVRGKVKGALRGRERVEVGRTGETRGEISTLRIAIEEGAQIHSTVEVTRGETPRSTRAVEKPSSSGAGVTQPMVMKAGADLQKLI